MTNITPKPGKIEIDFTDEAITPLAGSLFLSRAAEGLGLPEILRSDVRLKKRNRGADDAQMLLSMIYSMAGGDGAISDVERIRADEPRRIALGLSTSPASRRLNDYLLRFGVAQVEALEGVCRAMAGKVSPAVAAHMSQTLGYVPLFIDGTAIEVDGMYYEKAGKGYDGSVQYWLHQAYVGPLMVASRLMPGGSDVAGGWETLVAESKAVLMGHKVWARCDNAYYRREFVREVEANGWDFSISVTSGTYKKPLLEETESLPDDAWEAISSTEDAVFVYHKPSGWSREYPYVVIRSYYDGRQKLLSPRFSFILTSRDDLPLEEIIRRHRGKCGQENAQKGPLTDLDLHHPPCHRFDSNRAFYLLGQMAQNLLIAIQYELLPEEARSHGIRTVIREFVRVAGRLVRHGRKWMMKFAKTSLRLDWIARAANRLESGEAFATG